MKMFLYFILNLNWFLPLAGLCSLIVMTICQKLGLYKPSHMSVVQLMAKYQWEFYVGY